MAEEFKIGLGIELKSGELDNIRSQINNIQVSPITLTMNTRNVQNQLNSIRTQIQNLSNIRINLTGGNGNTGVQRTVADVTRAYNDLMNLQRRINSIRIQIGGLDANKNSSQISVLSGQLNRLMADYNNLYQVFNRDFSTDQLDSLNRAFEVASDKVSALNAKMADTSAAKQTEEAYRELYNTAKKIDSLELKIRGLDFDKNSNEVGELLLQLDDLRQTYQQLSTSLQGQLSPTQLSNLSAAVYDTQDKLRQLDAKVADTKKRLADGINVKFNNGTFTNDINKVTISLSKIRNQSTEVVTGMQELNNAFSAMQAAKGSRNIDALISSYERYQQALKNVKNQIEINQRAEQQNVNASKLAAAKQALSSQMDVWLKNNSAAAKQFGGQIEALKAKLNSCDAVQLDGIKSEFKEITRQAELAGKATQTFGDKLKDQMSKLGTYFSASMLISEGIQAIQSMYQNVVEVDTAMTGLYRVTDLTSEQYDALYDKMISSAKEYGSTLTDIVNSTADWVRLGFDANQANQLSEISAMYQHISDLDYGVAVENLVTAYKGFQNQLLTLYSGDEVAAIEYIADIFNELGNNYAVSAEDVGAALTRSASALDLAGNTIQESAAMVTGITEVTQDPEKAGSALKVLSLRLRGMKGELEALGEDVDENVESLSKMQTQVLNLTNGKVNIFNDDGSFKSTYEMMDEIADIYYDLSATDQADLLETIAGKNRANDIAALISNWNQVEKAMQSAMDAEGSAARENDKYMESIQGRLDALTTSWQALSNTVISSDFVKVVLDSITSLVDLLDVLIEKFGLLPTLLATISGAMSFKNNIGIFSTFDSQLTGITNKLGIFGKSFKDIIRDAKSGQGVFTTLFSNLTNKNGITDKDVDCITNFMNQIKNGVPTTQAWASTMKGATVAGKKMAVQVKSGAVELGTLTKSANTSKIAMVGLKVASAALNAALTMGLSIAIQAVITGLDKLIHSAKYASERADELKESTMQNSEAAQEEVKQLDELIAKYKELATSETQDTGTRTQIKSIQSQITDLVGQQASNLDLVNGKLNEELEKLLQIQRVSAENAVESATAAYHASRDSADKAQGSDSYAFVDGYAYVSEGWWNTDKEIAEYLQNNGYKNSVQFGGVANSNLFVMDTFDEEYNALDTVEKKIAFLQGMIETIKNSGIEDYASSDLYTGLIEQRDAYVEYVDDIVESSQSLLDSVIISETFSDKLGTMTVNSVESFEQYRAAMIEAVKNSPDLSEALSLGDITEEGIEKSVTDYMASVPQFNEYYNAWVRSIQAGTDEVVKATEEQKQKLMNTFKDSSITEWFNRLSEDEKHLLYTIDVEANDTTLWTLTRWKQELADLSATGQSSTESLEDFYAVLNNTEDGNFSDTINDKIEAITRLQEALVNINELTDEDILDLAMDFPSLVGKTGDVQTLSKAISELIQQTQIGLDGDFAAQLDALGGASTSAGQALLALQSMVNSVTAVGWNFDIDKEIEKFNNLYDAMKESVSGTGLSTDAIKNVENMFSGLEGYDPSVLFERTEHGIHLNTSALRTLQSQYESMNKLDIQTRLQDLKQEYNDTKHELDGLTAGTDEYNKKAAELKAIENQIYDVQTLAAQYEGLTSAYNKWILAQSSGEEGDMYDNITSSLEDIKQLYNDGLVGTNAFRTAVQMMTNEDLSTANVEKLMSVYQEGYPAMQRYFTDSQAGCIRFLEDVQSLNSEWASMNEDGQWEINFGVGNDAEIAAAISEMNGLEMSTEQVQIILRKLSDYGFDINLDSAYTSIDELKSRIETTEAKLKELGQDPIDIDVNATDVEAELEKAKTKIQEIKDNSTISPEVQTAQLDDAYAKIDVLVTKINQPQFMSISTSEVDSSIQGTLTLLQEYQTAVNNVTALELKGADASEIEAAKTKVNELAGQIEALPDDVKTTIGLETDGDIESIKSQIADDEVTISVTADTTSATTDIGNIEGTDVEVTVTTSGNAAVDTLKTAIDGIQDKKVKVSATTTGAAAVGLLSAAIALVKDKSVTVTSTTTGKDAVEGLTSAITLLQSKSVTATATAIGKINIDNLKAAIDAVYNKSVSVTANVYGKSSVDSLKKAIDKVYSKTVNVKANVSGTSDVNALKAAIDAVKSKTVTVTTITKTISSGSGGAGVDGTAHARGTAYSRGDWGTKSSGVALGGELGQELVVRDGKWFTIGDKSAEFFMYKKGDIIFNAEQTAEIFKKGKITHGSGRGRALAEGTAFSSGSGGFWSGGTPVISSGGISSGSSSDQSSASDSSNNKTEDFKESFDWIEIAIDRIERAIAHLDTKASSVYKSWSSRNKSLTEEMDVIKDEIELQEDAYSRYIQEADSVGLSSHMAELVRQGAIDIDTVENEELAEKIKQYQEWYEKALDCRDAIDELEESLAECYQTAFDNVVAQYDGILAIIGHEKSMLDEYVAQSEAKGYVTSSKYYEALIRNEQDNIAELSNEKDVLLAKLNEGLASGAIEKGSEAWYEMVNQIDEVTLAIEQGNTAILEYANSIRDIEWELFDMLQAQISQITNEADFLINLFSDDKLYDDRGQLTNEGMATMGLHGQNYNVYMAQADKYAQEILKIDKELANDPYNQDLLERRQELLELQQENILAAEDEKQAIVDMVREGIELELDALQELIDTYTDALDAQKDLYDYQKKLAEQTKKVADLEKQMSAYAGDTSEETKAKIQQIKVSLEEAKTNLEETEYQRYISDQKKLMDDLYIEYETILNQRLDNIDALLSDMITEINSNADMINTTLIEKAESVGITLSESMSSIWDTSVTGINTVLTTYGQNIQNGIASATTTVNSTLGTMNTNLQQMVAYLNTIANTKASSASSSSAGSSSNKSSSSSNKSSSSSSSNKSSSSSNNKSSSSSSTTKSSSSSSSSNKSSSSSGKITVGSTVNAGNAKIYDYAGDKSGETQYFRKDPTYTVLEEKDGYVRVRKTGLSSGTTGWFKKSDLKSYNTEYASGKYNFLGDEVAWTQDGGAEMIVRPSDGAILTPIARGDSVLSAFASGNIWEMANNPSEFIRDNLKLDGVDAPVGHGGETTYTQNLEQVVFNLPNVKNYEELLHSLKSDKNFERLIMAMTIDQMAGRTSLAKGKSIR